MADLRFQRLVGWLPWMIAAVLVILQARAAGDVIAGGFPDNDDMLRLQQVRDLLAGQNWFNVDQSRFLTPEGGEMHWSRLPDIFIGGLILLTRPFLGQAGAETFALIVYPLALLGWALAMAGLIAKRLGAGLAGQIAAIVLFALSSAALNFWPGRIDHHNLVVALTLTGFAAALTHRLSAQSAVITALCTVAAISVAIESLPYAGALILSFGLFWIVRGHEEGVRLASFGFALAVFACLFYLLDAPGIGPRRDVCDAYGTSHLAGLLGGGALLAALGVVGGWLDGWGKRLLAGAVAGSLTLALVLMVNPACLGNPYAEVSEQVRIGWLNTVGEARSLYAVWEGEPSRAVLQFGYVLAGLIATAFILWNSPANKRLPRFALALLMVLSALATIWQIRGATFSHSFAAIAGGLMIGAVFQHWREKGGVANVLALAAAIILMAPMTWDALSQRFADPEKLAQTTAPTGEPYNVACLDPQAYFHIRDVSYARYRILTPIDLGVSILVRSDNAVYGGPYHRNVLGIERVTRAYMSPPDGARAQIIEMGGTHILYCAGLNETARYARLAPGSLADMMEQGRLPEWLTPADKAEGWDGVVRLYKVKP